jgi:hypothetical protein
VTYIVHMRYDLFNEGMYFESSHPVVWTASVSISDLVHGVSAI